MRPVDLLRVEAEQQLDRLQERADADRRELIGCMGQHPAAAGRAGGRVSPCGAGANRGATRGRRQKAAAEGGRPAEGRRQTAGSAPGCARLEQRTHPLDATRGEPTQRTPGLLGLQWYRQGVRGCQRARVGVVSVLAARARGDAGSKAKARQRQVFRVHLHRKHQRVRAASIANCLPALVTAAAQVGQRTTAVPLHRSVLRWQEVGVRQRMRGGRMRRAPLACSPCPSPEPAYLAKSHHRSHQHRRSIRGEHGLCASVASRS